ncbi:MAG: BNR-4 repeat-containing protein [Patescibacteria group bacterium]
MAVAGLLAAIGAGTWFATVDWRADVLSKSKSVLLSSDAAWCWFQDPRAIYTNGQTIMTSNNRAGDVGVVTYAHATGQTRYYRLRQQLQVDDHAVPSLELTPDGRITAWYSAHGGSKLYYRTTTNPGDVSSWGPEKSLPFGAPQGTGSYGYTYPNPVYLAGEDGGKTYLFWRFHGQDPTLSTTTDRNNWSSARKFFKSRFRPYVKVASDGVDTIHFAVTDGHPLNVSENNIYHFYYRAGNWYRSNGTLIKTSSQLATSPITPAELGSGSKVYDASRTGRKSWVWDIALGSGGKPVVTYADFPNRDDHRYHYAKWDGSRWVDTELVAGGKGFAGKAGNEPWYSGGVVLDHSDTDVVYLSKQTEEEAWEIERWEFDGTWSSVSLTPGATRRNVRPVVPRNHKAGLSVVWMYGDYPHFTTFKTQYRGHP